MTVITREEHRETLEFEHRDDLHRCDECGTVISETAARTEYVEGLWFCDEGCREFYFEDELSES